MWDFNAHHHLYRIPSSLEQIPEAEKSRIKAKTFSPEWRNFKLTSHHFLTSYPRRNEVVYLHSNLITSRLSKNFNAKLRRHKPPKEQHKLNFAKANWVGFQNRLDDLLRDRAMPTDEYTARRALIYTKCRRSIQKDHISRLHPRDSSKLFRSSLTRWQKIWTKKIKFTRSKY